MLNKMIAPTPTVRFMLAACLAVAAPMASAQPSVPDVGTPGGIAFAADGTEAEPFAAAQPEPSRNQPDFLFGQPRGVVGISGGWLLASGGGFLDSVREVLTIDDRAYDALLFRFTGGVSLGPRIDLVFDVDVSQSRAVSEYRRFSDGGLPISQSTELRQIPMNAGVRFWVLGRGRRIGRLAWVPNTLALYVGGGGGARRYALTQVGDFVDFRDDVIFSDRWESRGWAASGHVSAGVSIKMSRRVYAVAEARRVWSQTELAPVFRWELMDLNGLQMTGGFEVVF